MSKLTIPQKQQLKDLVIDAMVKRLTPLEMQNEVQDKMQITISQDYLRHVKLSIKKDRKQIFEELRSAVQKRLDAEQKIAAFWKDFGGPISLIGGGFFGGFSGWIIGKFQRKKSKKIRFELIVLNYYPEYEFMKTKKINLNYYIKYLYYLMVG